MIYMRKLITRSFITLLAAGVFILSGCGRPSTAAGNDSKRSLDLHGLHDEEPPQGFTRIERTQEMYVSSDTTGSTDFHDTGTFEFSLDYPTDGNVNSDMIKRFLTVISDSPEYGSVDDINIFFSYLSRKILKIWRQDHTYSAANNEALLSLRVHALQPRFITFSKRYCVIESGRQRIEEETFHTFDLNTGKELANDDIFLPDHLHDAKMALSEVILNDPDYREWHPDAIHCDKEDLRYDLPQGALTDEGVIFSYQVNEMAPVEALHFIVPYAILAPYMQKRWQYLTTDV